MEERRGESEDSQRESDDGIRDGNNSKLNLPVNPPDQPPLAPDELHDKAILSAPVTESKDKVRGKNVSRGGRRKGRY